MLSLLLLFAAPAVQTKPAPPPYSAQVVVVSNGEKRVSSVWSDGSRRKTESVDASGKKSGSFTDETKGLQWLYGLSTGCLQMPVKPPADMNAQTKERLVGSETIDGHPTKKYEQTSTWTHDGKQQTDVAFIWRATDLGDLVIRRRSADGKTEMNVKNIVVGKPDAKQLALPADCHYDEMADTTNSAAEAPGGWRTIRFSDASCKKMIPLPLTLSIPSDYALRGTVQGCFWGTEDDLRGVLATPQEADFTHIRSGVFWCRISDNTEYDPQSKRFFSEGMGSDDRWPKSFAAMGARDVEMKRMTIAGLPMLTISARSGSQPVHMLYIGVLDSPAILINYHPAKGETSHAEVWQKFIDSIADARNH